MERPINSSHKRLRGSPTGATPSQARKKRVRPPKCTHVCTTLNFSKFYNHMPKFDSDGRKTWYSIRVHFLHVY